MNPHRLEGHKDESRKMKKVEKLVISGLIVPRKLASWIGKDRFFYMQIGGGGTGLYMRSLQNWGHFPLELGHMAMTLLANPLFQPIIQL